MSSVLNLQRERDEFIAMLVRDFPKKTVSEVLGFVNVITKMGRKSARVAVQACNVGLTERQQRYSDRLDKAIEQACADFGVTAKLGGDPRGYTVKVILPTGRYNTMGGQEEGWGVPGS